MSAPFLLFDKTLRNFILADADIRAAVSGQVFMDKAPANATPPFIIIGYSTPLRTQHVTKTPQMEAIYTIKAVVDVDVDGAERAFEIAEMLYNRLHNPTTKPDMEAGGWGVYFCRHESVVRFTEQTDHKNYQHVGGLYTVGATQFTEV